MPIFYCVGLADAAKHRKSLLLFSELMFESVEKRLPRDVPFFATLSGGIDSTLIASFAAETGTSVSTIFLH